MSNVGDIPAINRRVEVIWLTWRGLSKACGIQGNLLPATQVNKYQYTTVSLNLCPYSLGSKSPGVAPCMWRYNIKV